MRAAAAILQPGTTSTQVSGIGHERMAGSKVLLHRRATGATEKANVRLSTQRGA